MQHRLPPEPDDPGPLTDDAVTGSFRLWQRERGHRYSLDDVLTAWEAARLVPHARRCLDLGSGIGSVLHMLAHALPDAELEAIEAQRLSFGLLVRNVARNGLEGRVRLHHGDLRELTAETLARGPFDLVTGTPPYVPPGRATPSPDSQRAYARQELRGGVEAYVHAAAAVLAPHGRLVVCADARYPGRVFGAAAEAGLRVFRRRDAVPRARQKAPLFSVYCLQRLEAAPLPYAHLPDWHARSAAGERTAQYHEVRACFGFPRAAD